MRDIDVVDYRFLVTGSVLRAAPSDFDYAVVAFQSGERVFGDSFDETDFVFGNTAPGAPK